MTRSLILETKEAVAIRIIELCQMKNLTINALAEKSGLSSSTVYSLLNNKSKNPGIVTIKNICDGLNITLNEFFDSNYFNEIDQEE